jgi:hypothetical protein
MGLWSDDSTGAEMGLVTGQDLESAIFKTLGFELCGK